MPARFHAAGRSLPEKNRFAKRDEKPFPVDEVLLWI
jgi:hypothetical protein